VKAGDLGAVDRRADGEIAARQFRSAETAWRKTSLLVMAPISSVPRVRRLFDPNSVRRTNPKGMRRAGGLALRPAQSLPG
jgi:hypothetical protein